MSNCRHCGSPLRPGAKFCAKCGSSVVDDVSSNNSSQNRVQETTIPEAEIPKTIERIEESKPESGKGKSNIIKIALGILILLVAAFLFLGKSAGKSDNKETASNNAVPPVKITEATTSSTNKPNKSGETTTSNRPIKILKASATSFLKEPNQTYPASQAVDGDIKTCWVEGVPGYGHNEGIDIVFDDVYDIKGFNIWTGYQKSEDLFYKNSRPIGFMVKSSDGYSHYHEVKDIMGMQRVEFIKPVKAKSIMITLMEFRPGTKFEDTCISEISFF